MRSKEREHNGSNDFNVLESNVKRFGCWNVRSVNGREELFTEMKKYRLEVLGVSETKARGSGMKQIGDISCVFSGGQEGRAKLIANTWFPHKKIHMYTWECGGRGLRSLTDHFLIGKGYMKLVVDVKVIRGAELGSDHYLVIVNINLKMERRMRGMDRRMRQQIKINKLKAGEVRRKYQVIMSEVLEAC